VELDLDMVEEGAGGNLSTSKLFELVLFLPRSGVVIGVVSDISDESDSFDWCSEDKWSEAERKEKEELEGLVTFLDLRVRGDFGGNTPLGEIFGKFLCAKDGLTIVEDLASWLKP